MPCLRPNTPVLYIRYPELQEPKVPQTARTTPAESRLRPATTYVLQMTLDARAPRSRVFTVGSPELKISLTSAGTTRE